MFGQRTAPLSFNSSPLKLWPPFSACEEGRSQEEGGNSSRGKLGRVAAGALVSHGFGGSLAGRGKKLKLDREGENSGGERELQ